MGIYEEYKDVINSSLISQNSPIVSWNTFVFDLANVIISKYDNTSQNLYKNNWKQAYKKAVSDLKLNASEEDRVDSWGEIISNNLQQTSPTPSSSASSTSSPSPSSALTSVTSTSSPSYQKKLCPIDLANLEISHLKLHEKWKLSENNTAEDIMHECAKNFAVVHPAHSYILDMRESFWKEKFTQEEIAIVLNKQYVLDTPFPNDLQDIVAKLNKKTSCRLIYDAMNTVTAHPLDHPAKYWIKESIINYSLLFRSKTSLGRFETEQDLLDDVYGFIKTSCILSELNAFGAKQSRASSESRNSKRSIGSFMEEQRQQSAENADLYFRKDSTELLCLEIGLDDHGAKGTKELNESYIKTPMMMRDFCERIVSQYKFNPVNIKIAGIVISGLNITGMVMSFNNGSVSLLSSSERLRMPESVTEIPRLLPPVLNLIYNLNNALKETVSELDDINSSVTFGPAEPFFFPPSFVPLNTVNTTTNKKQRKSTKGTN